MRRSILIPFSTALLSVSILSGCGQRGPLYLPEDMAPKPPLVAPVSTEAPVTTEAPTTTASPQPSESQPQP